MFPQLSNQEAVAEVLSNPLPDENYAEEEVDIFDYADENWQNSSRTVQPFNKSG